MPSSSPIWVLLVDDSDLLAASLALVFEALDDIELLAVARSGQEALNICAHFLPDVVLMDVMLPDMSGIEVTHRLRHLYPDIPVVFLSNYAQDDIIEDAYHAGARDFLVKNISIDDIADAVRRASM